MPISLCFKGNKHKVGRKRVKLQRLGRVLVRLTTTSARTVYKPGALRRACRLTFAVVQRSCELVVSLHCIPLAPKVTMADAATAAPAAPAKSPKKKASKPKKPSSHPKYSEMIAKALAALKERGGSSRQAILKYIAKNFSVGKDERVINQHLKMALRAGVKNGSLKQSKGTGASGSFKLGAEKKAAKPKKAKKPKAAKKPKKPKAKKPKAAGEKKKVKKPRSPKKAKPAKAKKPKATKAAKPKKPKAAKPKKPKAAKPKKAAAKKTAKK